MLLYTLIEYDTINLPIESSIYILNSDIINDDNFVCKSMKSLMSIPTLLTVLVIAAVIALPPLPLPISSYSDDSETTTEQRLKQKNVGSGESTNFNCGENLIDSAVSAICSAEPPPQPPETATISVCKETSIENTSPEDFDFTVTGGDPAEFQGSANCVDVEIGPGEYTVSETAPGNLAPGVEIIGDCEQSLIDPQTAIGEIQAGETQVCRFINSPGAS
jgi:hypothetical protein